MFKFIQVSEVTNSGASILHTINAAHIVKLSDHQHYAACISLIDGTSIVIDRAQAATVRTALLSDNAPSENTQDAAPVPAFDNTPRVDYCSIPGHNRAAYLEAQRNMFAVARKAGLDTSLRDEMIYAIALHLNVFLNSRKELTPAEMIRVANAIECGHIHWSAPQLRAVA